MPEGGLATHHAPGALTPLPFACIALNSLVWVLYGIMLRDWVPMAATRAAKRSLGRREKIVSG